MYLIPPDLRKQDTIYIHAGCPVKGRSTELHSYTPSTGAWKTLASGLEPARGGTALAVVQTSSGPVLARYGGFAGYELAGPLHFYLVCHRPTELGNNSMSS